MDGVHWPQNRQGETGSRGWSSDWLRSKRLEYLGKEGKRTASSNRRAGGQFSKQVGQYKSIYLPLVSILDYAKRKENLEQRSAYIARSLVGKQYAASQKGGRRELIGRWNGTFLRNHFSHFWQRQTN